MILGAVHRSPRICLTADENSGKPQLGERNERSAANLRLKWGPFPLNEVGEIAQNVSKCKRREEGKECRDPICSQGLRCNCRLNCLQID